MDEKCNRDDALSSLDLFILASVCVRQRLNVQSLAILALLYRRGELYASEVIKYSGVSKSKTYDALYYLMSKGLARQKMVRDAYKGSSLWSLTADGKRLVREYETCYRKLRKWLFERW